MINKRIIACLAIALVSLQSCSSVKTFDASIVGIQEVYSGGPSRSGLKLESPSSEFASSVITLGECEKLQQKCGKAVTFLSIDGNSGTFRMVNFESGGTKLSASDLRVGQNVLVNYAFAADLEPQTLRIKDYVPPNRFLRLTIKTDLPETKQDSTNVTPIEALIFAQLSWRLPQDIGIVRDPEATENSAIIGDLDVSYSELVLDTQWMFRKETVITLNLKTRLTDPRSSSNWSDLSVKGGSFPAGSDASSYSHKNAMMGVPMFEIRSAG